MGFGQKDRNKIFINQDENKYNSPPSDTTELQMDKWPWTKVVRPTLKIHCHSAKKQLVQPKSYNNADKLCHLTFGFQVPVEGAVLRKPAPTLVTLERLFPGVVADVAHQRALLAKAPAAVLADIRLVLQMRAEMNLLGVLYRERQERGS